MLFRSWLAALAGIGCSGLHPTQPTRPPAEFCAAVIAGDLNRAEQSGRGALVEANALALDDATAPFADWLRRQPCVANVDVSREVIETDPGIREITFQLVVGTDKLVRTCVADLKLAPGGHVEIHPAIHATSNPDTRCSAL